MTRTAGVLGYALAGVAIYTAWALLLEDVRGHTVLPVGRTGPAWEAIEGSLDAQPAGYEHLAGVRRTSERTRRPAQIPAGRGIGRICSKQ